MTTPRRKARTVRAPDIDIRLARELSVPLFVQIQENLQALVRDGSLIHGDRLPPVRALAAKLDVNQVTVSRAYKALSDQGVARGRRGAGTVICDTGAAPTRSAPPRNEEDSAFRPLLADRLFELSRAPGVVAFTSNYPMVGREVIEEFRTCLQLAAGKNFDSYFHYDPPLGRTAARNAVARHLAQQDIQASPDNIVLTSGGQQAIDLAVRSLVPPGAAVVIERPAYYGVINALRGVAAQILEVPLTADGMDLDVLEKHLSRHRVRMIYVNPTFQNPTGITTSEAKRRELLALARRFGAVILEDDHSSGLRFAGMPIPSIAALSTPEDLVMYAHGFGKTLLPGQRLGFLSVPPGLRHAILNAKAAADLHGNPLMQVALAHFLERGQHPAFLQSMRDIYGARQRLVRKRLAALMPPGTQISAPDGGLSLWIKLPEGAQTAELYFRAVGRGVAFLPGEVFYVSPPDVQAMRISFGLVPENDLLEGVDRLCAVVGDLVVPRSERSVVLT